MILSISTILIILVVWGIMEYRKPIIIPLNEEEQKILKLLKDNIEGSEYTINKGRDFEYIFITTNIKGLTFQYYKSFIFGGESVSLYLNDKYVITTYEYKIFISSRLEKSIIEVLKPYTRKIISEEREKIDKRYLEERQKIDEGLKEVLKNIKN